MVLDLFKNVFVSDPTIKRHLLKSVSWRILGSIDTLFLGWFVTGQLSVGAQIGALELVTKMVFYFIHERVWHRISFGLPTRTSKANKVKQQNEGKLFAQQDLIDRKQRESLNGHKAYTIWLTGLSGSGKSTIAKALEAWFYEQRVRAFVLDGDNTRLGLNSDLSFSNEDRKENIRRVAQVSKLINDAGSIVIASFIAPFEEDRAGARAIIGNGNFLEVFVDASLATCKSRDTKGLYKLAEVGKIKDFTGVSSPYERPKSPDVHINTDSASVEDSLNAVIAFLQSTGLIAKVSSE